MQIHLTYYAILRDRRGLDRETVDMSDGNLRALYRRLRQDYDFPYDETHIRPAVNDAFCPWEQPLNGGDHVVFVSPVAGG
jgi:molybdopterin synthase sulfur carrier subunit